MAILNCSSCGSVATATFDGGECPDTDNFLIEDIEFAVTLDAHTGAPIVQVDPTCIQMYQKLNMPYWDQLMVINIQQGTLDMCCQCGDQVSYDVRYTQTQAPPQQPAAPTPPPSVGGILAGGSVAGLGLSGSGAVPGGG